MLKNLQDTATRWIFWPYLQDFFLCLWMRFFPFLMQNQKRNVLLKYFIYLIHVFNIVKPITLNYIHSCTELLWSGDGQVLTFLLCGIQYVHTYMVRWGSALGGSAMLARAENIWCMWFQSGGRHLGVKPIHCEADFAPFPSPLCDCVCVNACNDLCWSQILPTSLCIHLNLLHACVNVPLIPSIRSVSI